MATSGVITYSPAFLDLVLEAYEIAGGKDMAAASIPAHMLESAKRSLNLIIKAWQAEEIFLWKSEYATLFLAPGTVQYALGSVHATKSYVATAATAAAASGASSIVVVSVTGLAVGQNIGVMLSTNALQWFTISNIASTTITLSGALSASVVSGAAVYAYTTRLVRPYEVRGASMISGDGTQQYELHQASRERYNSIPAGTTSGQPIEWYYQAKRTAAPLFTIYPKPETSLDLIRLDVVEVIEDLVSGDNEVDIPQAWLNPLVRALAVVLAEKLGASAEHIMRLEGKAQDALALVRGSDREPYCQFGLQQWL